MSNIVGYAIGEYVGDTDDDDDYDDDDEKRDFYEIVTAWIHPKYVNFFPPLDTFWIFNFYIILI